MVDNASSDDSVAVIKKDFQEVILIENINNLGFAKANNQGFAIANKTNNIILLNNDTSYPDADWMPTVEEAVEARQAAGRILTWFERALPEALEA